MSGCEWERFWKEYCWGKKPSNFTLTGKILFEKNTSLTYYWQHNCSFKQTSESQVPRTNFNFLVMISCTFMFVCVWSCFFFFPPSQTSKECVTSNSQSTTPLVIIICQSTPEIISCTSTPRHQTWQLHLRMHYSCSRVAVSCSTIRYAKTVTFIPQQRFRNTHHLHRSVCPSHGPANTKSPLCDNHRAG